MKTCVKSFDPIRIIVIGLPFSGKDQVAKILNERY